MAEKQQLVEQQERSRQDIAQMWKSLWWLMELLKNECDAAERDIFSIDEKIASYSKLLTKQTLKVTYETVDFPVDAPIAEVADTSKHLLSKQVRTGQSLNSLNNHWLNEPA